MSEFTSSLMGVTVYPKPDRATEAWKDGSTIIGATIVAIWVEPPARYEASKLRALVHVLPGHPPHSGELRAVFLDDFCLI